MISRPSVAVLLLALSTACAMPRVVRLDTGQGAPLEYRPPTSNKPVKVDADAFEKALARWVLNESLTLRPAQRGWLVRASYPSNDPDTRWGRLMSQSFGGLCKAGQRREDCLSLLDDVMGLSEWAKLGVLAANPEPVFTKAAAIVSAVLLMGASQ